MSKRRLPKEVHDKAMKDLMEGNFKNLPDPKPGVPYGYTKKQLEVVTIPHRHNVDVCLVYGGTRGGKSVVVVGLALEYLLANPGSIAAFGAENYPLLKRTVIKEFKDRFTLPGYGEWSHPAIARYPTDHNKELVLFNNSKVVFFHLSDFEILRGVDLGFAEIEEASLLKDSGSIEEFQRRLSNNKVNVRRLLVTSNPEESKGWIYEAFSLKQYERDYKGDRMMVGKPCKCQYCPKCLDVLKIEILFDEDGYCPNQNCPHFDTQRDWGILDNDLVAWKKDNNCPGDQEFWRVVMVNPQDNANLPSDYIQSNKAGMDEKVAQLYLEGAVMELRTGKAYEPYSSDNKHKKDIPLDYSKEMFWSFDFNVRFQCSVVAQEKTIDDIQYADIIDEFVIPNAGTQEVAIEWMNRYWDYEGLVNIIFDPAAFNNSVTADDGAIRIKSMVEVLTNPEKFGFPDAKPKRVNLLTKKIKGKTKVPVVGAVDTTNWMLKDANGLMRLMINPKCKWLIASLEDMVWEDKTLNLKTLCDKLAAKRTNNKVCLLSHPTDALRYYCYNRFKSIKDRYVSRTAILPGEGVVIQNEDGSVSEFEDEQFKQYEQALKEKDKADALNPPEMASYGKGLLGFLTDIGAVGGIFGHHDDDTLLGQFFK